MAIAIDASSPAIVLTTADPVTTASFSPPANTLLVACVFVENSTDPAISISNTGTSLTWTQRALRTTAEAGSNAGEVAIYTAPNTNSQSGITVTASITGVTSVAAIKVYVLTGADLSTPVGATGEGTSTTNNVTVNAYTSTVNNSRGICAAHDWLALGAPSSTDDEETFSNGALSGMAITKSANTTPSSSSVTFNLDAAGTSTPRWQWVAVEIKPGTQDASIAPSPVDASANIPSPGLSAGQTIPAAAVDASAIIPTASLGAGATVSPGSVDALAVIPSPTITTEDVEAVAPATVTAAADIPTPGISAGQTIPAGTVTAAADIPTPSVSAQFNVSFTPATVLAQALIPLPSVTVPVLPGSLITGNYQIEFNTSILFGSGVYQILAGSVEGWDDLVELDSGNVLRPARHGAWPGRKFGQQRYVSAVVLVADESDDFMDRIAALRRATGVAEDETELPLVIRTRGETLLAFGQVIGRVVPPELYYAGFSPVALRWECSDPRRYGLTLHSELVGTSTAAVLANDGDIATSPRVRVFGPAENPVVTNETLNRVMAFDLQVENGQRLDIDCAAGTVKIGQVDRMSTLSALSVPVDDWVLAAGDNTISYTVDSAGTGGIEVLYRDAYL